ncbi:hypothetical protein AU467_25365 [Mesorhizobium loti]|uniref:Antitoxin SocA-like Panacea domain-containing protein n=1 Tax=Rhizobium loti TaxID=381 RepID=A0A101KRJ5_RHILI|nr:hypothetical protein AU467_25365 [Mesorhizobium loti]
MIEREEHVAAIVDAAGGRLVSRVRLQKIAYLLDQLGMDSGFDYQYYHYGPYSRDLDSAILDAEAFDYIEEKFESRQSDGARYSVFEIKKPPESNTFGHLDVSKAKQIVRKLANANVTVLELAATAHWLAEEEKVSDWRKEIVRRKGPKTENNRLGKALDLLRELNLPPAQSTAA